MRDDFDMDFMSEEELEEMLDAYVDGVKDEIIEDELRTTMVNLPRIDQFKFAYAALQYIMKGKRVNIYYKMFEPFKTMGSITVEGTVLEFDKPEWFARVAEFASNTEVYPLAKNAVRMTFTFHGLTTPIE